MGDVGDDDGGHAEEESGVELAVFAEEHHGGNDSVNRFEVVGEVGGIGAEMAQEVDVKGIGENRAGPCQDQQPEPVTTLELEQAVVGAGAIEPRQS